MKDTKEIIKELEQGVQNVYTSDNYINYLATMAKFHNYSINNTILIYMQMPNASRVAGYTSWKTKFHRQVKKGEKAIAILAPIPHKAMKLVTNKDGNEEEKEIHWNTFKVVPVFDISQTEGEELPELCKELTEDVQDFEKVVSKLQNVAKCPITFEEIQNGAKGYYRRDTDEIVINTGMSQAQTIKTMAHEIAHSILHREGSPYENIDRDTKEIQAESVAYVVCNALGINTSGYSFEYVAGWSNGKGITELQSNFEIIKNTANDMIGEVRA